MEYENRIKVYLNEAYDNRDEMKAKLGVIRELIETELPNLFKSLDIENEERNKMIEIFVKEMNQEFHKNHYTVILLFSTLLITD